MLGRFSRDRRGNVAIIFGFAVIPMMLMGGIAIDYTRDAMIHGRMSAVADAAALAATTPAMFAADTTTAQAAAIAMFKAQAALVNGANINYNNGSYCSTGTTGTTAGATGLCVNVNDSIVMNSKLRTVTVTATVSVNNFFGTLEHSPTTEFTISSVANVSTAPNINFYVLLDSSPSMELPATTAGINTMVKNTGCALACHETDFKDPELSHYPGWGTNDSYTYAEKNGITLRIDNVRQAAEGLVTTANNLMDQYNSSAPPGQQIAYQMSAHTFSDGATQLLALKPVTDANVSSMQKAISAITPPLMADNSYLASGSSYTYPTGTSTYKTVTLSGKTYNNDAGTNFNNALTTMNNTKVMANPGSGTNNAGDSPQGVLLIVTDGVDDVALYKNSSCNTSQVWSFSNSYGNFYRCQQPVNTVLCSTIKARGIRIAVLYTTYYPVTSNSWYNNTVAPFMSQVSSNLQSCASSPELFAEVSTDGDITAALNQLFINAVNSAPHLVQ
ncbi:pilus assembly protein TadG-related protein [Rhodoblastus acidophilus]|uniref:Pilus assembly protein TadG-related protein n=1 Tax=Candidatus Rhodoblastus alkanivorans TaxID=2954117 RepID=A0ABS9Z3E1_9HYPH|nr:pilus assembly protein TadG-related protein [Candidatus Rhodoblastus alkanivorans]MCI4679722.1 pilus assembly protein TadG-related protein [Candidatus Rhodoblastus alkanivorans]MCI4681960.1 pilus assembly protein TadG-related protein [Candidatus Rhodoblastus alkanivorans]MDI4643010.1 pilus assembly protein TadG-related protein [Rhodoblastus acidophilus]